MYVLKDMISVVLGSDPGMVEQCRFFFIVFSRYTCSHSSYFHLGDNSILSYPNLFTSAYTSFGFSLSESVWVQIKSGKEYVVFKHFITR
jgi:hypothetical protein